MKRLWLACSVVTALALVQVPSPAADTVVASCSGTYAQPRVCGGKFTVAGSGTHATIIRFTPPGPFVINGQTIGFTGKLSLHVTTGSGAAHPCPDDAYGTCNVSIDYRLGEPYQYEATGMVGPAPTTSSNVPLAHLSSGQLFPYTVSCQTTIVDVYLPTAWCGYGSDMPGNGAVAQAYRDNYPRDGYVAAQIVVTG